MTGLQHAPLLRQESKTFQKEQPPRFMQKSIQLTPTAIGQVAVSMNQEAGFLLPRDMLVFTRNSMQLQNLWPFVPGFSKQFVKNTNEILNESFFSPYTQQKSLLVLRSLSHWALGSRLTFPWKMMLCLESGKFLGSSHAFTFVSQSVVLFGEAVNPLWDRAWLVEVGHYGWLLKVTIWLWLLSFSLFPGPPCCK